MAEGILRYLLGDRYAAYSAGTEPSGVNPYSIKVMREIGIDISKHRSKSVNEFRDQQFDYVITVCSSARETCPLFPGKYEKIHWDLEDPGKAQGSEKEILVVFRKVRDQIKQHIITIFR